MNILITGGCGFIGTNLALKMLEIGHQVTILDSLVRPGAERNLTFLEAAASPTSCFGFVRGDVAEHTTVDAVVNSADIVFHLAAQVSVVAAANNPATDFRSNVIGTFNVLEAARRSERDPIILVASTNKVYGGLDRLYHEEEMTRWTLPQRPCGIGEEDPLDLVTPYACSKGAAELYAVDYARTFGVRTVVFRQSCIYGPRQHAMEEQAWAAWFIKAALTGRQITIFGDGKQVRDLLHVDDLINAYMGAIQAIERAAGRVFNIGGGPTMTLSIWHEFGDWLQNAIGRRIPVAYALPRVGDQRVFISDTSRAQAELGWRPQIGLAAGLADLLSWVRSDISAKVNI
jgi:CDP-paratose 2-epimerase